MLIQSSTLQQSPLNLTKSCSTGLHWTKEKTHRYIHPAFNVSFLAYTLLSQDIGLIVAGNDVKISHLLRQHLIDLVFPLTGQVTIQDNRATCDDQPGPCSASVKFALELVQYEVPCPDDLLRFTAEETASVEWTAPVVRKLSGLSQTLSGQYTPGVEMDLGKTLVEYSFPMHENQHPSTRVGCSFMVRDPIRMYFPCPIVWNSVRLTC